MTDILTAINVTDIHIPRS